MNDIFTFNSIVKGIAEVEEDFVLAATPMSRLVFSAQIHNGGIRGRIIRQRRENSNDQWVREEAIDIRTLGKKESINFEIDTAAVENMYSAITKLAQVLETKGFKYGQNKFAVVDPSEIIITDKNKAHCIRQLLDAGHSEEVWQSLVEADPTLATKLSHAQIIAERQKVLEEFRLSLEQEKNENYWQKFFKTNSWIFGYGLRYQFLNLVTDQPHYTGTNYQGIGGQRGDYLLNSEAEKKFTVLVEIKKPETKLVLDRAYRAGTWKLGEELLWATSQLQINCMTWFRDGARQDVNKDALESQDIYTYRPKGILVIGHTNQLLDRVHIQTFEAYRRELSNPEIVTFDELYERAKFIVETGSDTRTTK